MTLGSPAHVADLLHHLSGDPGRPRVTWYGDGGERIELSSAVFDNWVNKSVNLLVEEFDASPGAVVVLDAPGHWRSLVWATAAWRCGATVTTAPEDGPILSADVVISTRPNRWAGASAEVVALALPGLARRFDGDLPPGAIDAAAAVMTYGDRLGYVPDVDGDAVALSSTEEITHADLLAWAGSAPVLGPDGGPERVLVEASAQDLTGTLRAALGALVRGGSVVLVSPEVAAGLRTDAARRARLVDGERVTHGALDADSPAG